ncbi:MAG TPA: hypothetical protein VLC10_03680 [Patescibacteria group bacterium]|nr:hypothetical protein [Patescibacteria group bacterium]
MSPTRSLVLSAAASVAASLAAYAAFRAFGAASADACVRTCIVAAALFAAGSAAIRVRAGSFTTAASAAIVGVGSTMIGTLFAASRSADMFGLLLVGFVLGVALSVFALTKDLDEKASPKLLLAVPMAQMLVLLAVFGH